MAQNRIEVLLTAKDQISSTVAGMVANIGSTLANVASMVANTMQLTNGIQSAATTQTSMISSAGDVATLMGTNYLSALKTVKDVQKEIAQMSASLPGETAGFGAIANAINSTMAAGAKGDLKRYKADLIDVTRTMGLLAATSGVNMNQAASASIKFVNGTGSLQQLFSTNDVFQKNQVYRTYLQEQLAAIGKNEKDWKTLSQDMRTRLIVLAGKKKFTQDTLDNFNSSAESLMQSVKSKLFDPQIGIFGFLREVRGLDGRDGLTAFATFLGQIDKLGTNLATLAAKNGIEIDPILLLGRMFDNLSGWAAGLNQLVTGGGEAGILTMIRDLGGTILNLPQQAANLVNNMLSGMSALMGRVTPQKAGGAVAALFNNLFTALASINVSDAVKGFNWIVQSLGELFKRVDWRKLGETTANALATVLTTLDWDGIGQTIIDMFTGIIQGLAGFITKSLENIYNATVTPVTSTISEKVNTATGGLLGEAKGKPRSKVNIATSKAIKNAIPAATPLGGAIKAVEAVKDLILPKKEESKPRAALPAVGQMAANNSNSSVFAPTIQLTGGMGDLQATADYMLSELNRQYLQYRDGVLA